MNTLQRGPAAPGGNRHGARSTVGGQKVGGQFRSVQSTESGPLHAPPAPGSWDPLLADLNGNVIRNPEQHRQLAQPAAPARAVPLPAMPPEMPVLTNMPGCPMQVDVALIGDLRAVQMSQTMLPGKLICTDSNALAYISPGGRALLMSANGSILHPHTNPDDDLQMQGSWSSSPEERAETVVAVLVASMSMDAISKSDFTRNGDRYEIQDASIDESNDAAVVHLFVESLASGQRVALLYNSSTQYTAASDEYDRPIDSMHAYQVVDEVLRDLHPNANANTAFGSVIKLFRADPDHGASRHSRRRAVA